MCDKSEEKNIPLQNSCRQAYKLMLTQLSVSNLNYNKNSEIKLLFNNSKFQHRFALNNTLTYNLGIKKL